MVIHSEEAFADFERIIEFLLGTSSDDAARALASIHGAIRALGDHPLIGPRVAAEMRELVMSHGATGYVALYRFDRTHDAVRILRIRHQRDAGYRE
ncbi:MAG: type II toxin-antitoxin system RelE/ParE family toxin [Betaproteobacteria bacterium]|nr:type II toxin-antitoxin system RelE/ParE family toxin [Betaproteobacteria bacterium]MDE2004146.1 type II toxin-antitoxin system RelE/ParE family toxin [Betaproteobacteria bacterium]MDE2210383.1 type II toxin-antitoxin system RelE/ParE family toxin [Betaproteobacteria bacterium]MDE2358286.1 type II toxin-antitoxin system RelE/ParE family toxin [Betaproteobacteria bacterium]